MCNSDYEERIVHQFDSFCKTVLRNQARTIYASEKRRNKRFTSLEALTPSELSQLAIVNVYDSDCVIIKIYDYEINIEDLLLAQAIEHLSKRQQDIILLSYFLDMKNVEIASVMNLKESTIHYHKEKALKKLKQYMEERTNGKR